MILALAANCSSSTTASRLTIFAAAGAKPAIDEIGNLFGKQYAIDVEISYGGGGEMLSRMILARSGDVYIAPEQGFMVSAGEKQAIDPATIQNIAYMVPVVAVPEGNPKQILALADLAKPGVRVAICRPESTLLGKYALEIFQKAGLGEALEKNIVTFASDPNNLLNMLFMGQVDAGIIWHFYKALAPDKIEIVFLSPEQLTGIGEMQIAVSAYSQNIKLARQFVNFAASTEGRDVFKKHGYLVDAQEVKRYGTGSNS